MRWALDAPGGGARAALAVPAAAEGRAEALLRSALGKGPAAPGALALDRGPAEVAAAVRPESRVAVRADDLEVLEAVVVGPAVDVVKDERHLAAAPVLSLAAELAATLLQAGLVQALLEMASVVGTAGHEHFFEGD